MSILFDFAVEGSFGETDFLGGDLTVTSGEFERPIDTFASAVFDEQRVFLQRRYILRIAGRDLDRGGGNSIFEIS